MRGSQPKSHFSTSKLNTHLNATYKSSPKHYKWNKKIYDLTIKVNSHLDRGTGNRIKWPIMRTSRHKGRRRRRVFTAV